MNKRILGNTKIEVSEIAFGGVEIGLPYGINANSQANMPTDQEAICLLRDAEENGINFFDTARLYGRCEELMGKAFADIRSNVVLCTKCAHLYDAKKQLLPEEILRKTIDDSLCQSLDALKTDYIDIYMVHNASMELLGLRCITDIFAEYRRKGIILATGVSTYTVNETKKAIQSGIWDVIQLPFNLMDQSHGELFSLARQNGVAIVVRSVLLKGVLTDKGRNLHPALKAVEQHRQTYYNLLDEQVQDLPDLAVKFVLSHNEVGSALIGMEKREYLQKALSIADGSYLDQETFLRAKQMAFPEPEMLDLTKWNKMGWLT